ncbi:PREDICTED: general transcription factor IIH subunit 1-like [Priapulus caudatus]|uniref:General transcription factor IIH subunit 1-like n=1 Tax=Priapulus caudatus TaxID=37621 RepID=A0ABM1ED17_PRICU|nr:PREDICTED: general transcription factor IIH subunit 1-like [Priapulus caudatus]
MAASSESVLLYISNVRCKKVEGTLYIFETRMAWQQSSKDIFSISHNYADIKMQKISPEGKSKVQLQIVLHDGGSTTFHFNNPEGEQAQRKDRNEVKELLIQLLPRFKLKVNKELEEKNRKLQEDPELFKLYMDLVVSQVLTADEFWANIANKPDTGGGGAPQSVGVSGAFLADVKPQSDGVNAITYNLTTDIIESIFKTYPAVKKKHLENVPHKLSESEFWTRFFQSHYFHRDRLTAGNKDLFSECAKSDDQDLLAEAWKVSENPLVDIANFYDDPEDEGYGGAAVDKTSTTHQVNQNMIRRFNHHSTMVLKTADDSAGNKSTPSVSNGNTTLPAAAISEASNGSFADDSSCSSWVVEPPANKRSKLIEKLEYDDLEGEETRRTARLNLVKRDRYYHGPMTLQRAEYRSNDEIIASLQAFTDAIAAWQPALPEVLPSSIAVGVMGELSPGGVLMQGGTTDALLNQMVSQPIQKDMKAIYISLCELLRHFYACFPVTSKALEEKVVKMKGTLDRFHMVKMRPFQESVMRQHYTVNLTGHLDEMLQAAYKKYEAWEAKKTGGGRPR